MRENLSLLRVPLSRGGGWVQDPPTHPPPPPAGANARLIAHPPTHPVFFEIFRDGAQGPRAAHARRRPRLCVASTSWERAAAAIANGSGAHAPNGAGSAVHSSALVACARSIWRPRRRALLLPRTKRGVEAGAMRRPEGVVCMHRTTCGAAALKAKITAKGRSFRARGCDQNVAVLLLHTCTRAVRILRLTHFFSKRMSDATPPFPHPHPPARTARPSAGPTHPPRFS